MRVYFCVTVFLLSEMCYSADYTELVGYEGQSARIDCHYPPDNEDRGKYFCRLQGFSCEDLIRTTTQDAWVKLGRFALFDDTRARMFTLKISNLSLDDTGKYWCGVDVSMLPDINTEVRIFVKGKAARQVNVVGETPETGVENSTSPVTMQKTVNISSPAVREKQSHFRFLTVITLACVGMLLFVCVFSLVQLLKRISSCNLSVSASYKITERPNSGHTEDDYVRMRPGVTRVTSHVDEPSSHQQPHHTGPAEGSVNIPVIDPYYLQPFIAMNAALDPDYIDLSIPRLSSVYENLRDESLQESVYHTIDVTSI